ncbi:GNAT family N-acetyltransferase [Mycoplasmatota bacterium]|nr:GNAT family N-acetyltransferase [Mycoplasmatota bacterium]
MISYQTDLKSINQEMLEGFFVGWKKPLSKEEHFQILQNSQYIVVAIDHTKNQVVGFINALSDKVQFAFIPMLEVLPDYQNQKIGSHLMELMLNSLNHINNIDLTCDKPLQAFYQKFKMLNSQGMIIRKYLNNN